MAKGKRVTVEPDDRDRGWLWLCLDGERLSASSGRVIVTKVADILNAAFDKTESDARADERKRCTERVTRKLMGHLRSCCRGELDLLEEELEGAK